MENENAVLDQITEHLEDVTKGWIAAALIPTLKRCGTDEFYYTKDPWEITIPGFHTHLDVSSSEKNKLSFKDTPVSAKGETMDEAVENIITICEEHPISAGDVCNRTCPHYFEF